MTGAWCTHAVILAMQHLTVRALDILTWELLLTTTLFSMMATLDWPLYSDHTPSPALAFYIIPYRSFARFAIYYIHYANNKKKRTCISPTPY